MSTLKLENIKHMNSTVNNISVDSDGSTYFDSDLMTIDATNNYVGVGTLSPAAKLHISGGSNNQFKVSSTGAEANLTLDGGSYAQINNTTGALYVTNNNATDIYFRTASTTRMTVDGSGRVTMPYQPMCFVTRISEQAVSNDAGNPTDLVLNTVEYNVGNHFNDANSRWTAPVTGYYEFSWSYGTKSGSPSVYRTFLWKNGSRLNQTQLRNDSLGTSAYTFGSRTAIVQMNTNDYVVLRASTDSGANFYADSQLRIVLTVRLIG